MKLPANIVLPNILPEAEYDAMFSMPPRKLAKIFQNLSEYRTEIVAISIREEQGVSHLSFIKQRPRFKDRVIDSPPNAIEDRDCVINANDIQHSKVPVIEIENWIKIAGIEKSHCMICLHEYINVVTKMATDVAMYLSVNQPTVIVHTVAGEENRAYRPPLANHYIHHPIGDREYQRKYAIWEESDDEMAEMERDYVDDGAEEGRDEAEEAVMEQKIERAEGGDGKQGTKRGAEDGKGDSETKRQKLDPEDGEGRGDKSDDDHEMVQKESDDDHEMVQKESDDDHEMAPKEEGDQSDG